MNLKAKCLKSDKKKLYSITKSLKHILSNDNTNKFLSITQKKIHVYNNIFTLYKNNLKIYINVYINGYTQ